MGQTDLYILQSTDYSCAIRSQQIILRDYGIIASEKELISFADKNGWCNYGTMPQDAGKLLNAFGVNATFSTNNTVDSIIGEHKQGHRVIVAVDS